MTTACTAGTNLDSAIVCTYDADTNIVTVTGGFPTFLRSGWTFRVTLDSTKNPVTT